MKIKLDENISRHLKKELSAFDVDICTAADEGLLGKPDTTIGQAAKKEGRILLTLDLEFGDLRKYPPGSHPGIILFRPKSLGPLQVNHVIKDFVRKAELTNFSGCNVVVEPSRIRVRRPSDEKPPEKSRRHPH